jgi:Flp pilus assembly protein TadG
MTTSSERGAVTAWTVVLVLPMLLVAGLAVDGGAILAERRAVTDVARGAALAGAQAIDEQAVRSGNIAHDPAAVKAAASAHLARHGHSGTVDVEDGTITVTVTAEVHPQILQAIGLGTQTVTGTSHARLVRGITEVDQ